jgi:ligand-binding SRPBCC domain-containing protein
MRKASSHSIDLSEIADRLSRAAVVETSSLAAPPASVWERIASMTGVNAELMPLVRMTFPSEYERLDTAALETGRPLFRSVVLLFGLLPIDVHRLTLIKLDPGAGFLECSTSLLQRYWIHERRLKVAGQGTRIRDRVYFECRLPMLARTLTPIIRGIFRHRHARLRRHFGGMPPGP